MRTLSATVFIIILVASQASLIEQLLDGISHRGSGGYSSNGSNVTLGYNGSVFYNISGYILPILNMTMNFSTAPVAVSTNATNASFAVGYNGGISVIGSGRNMGSLNLRGVSKGFSVVNTTDLKNLTMRQGLSDNHTLVIATDDATLIAKTSTAYNVNGVISANGTNASVRQEVGFDLSSGGQVFGNVENFTLYNYNKSSRAKVATTTQSNVSSSSDIRVAYNGSVGFTDQTDLQILNDSARTVRQGGSNFTGRMRSQVSNDGNISVGTVEKYNYSYDEAISSPGSNGTNSSNNGTVDTFTVFNMTGKNTSTVSVVHGGKINHSKRFRGGQPNANYTYEWKTGTNTTTTRVGNASSVESVNALIHRYAGNEGPYSKWDDKGKIGTNHHIRTNNSRLEDHRFEIHQNPTFADVLANITAPMI